MSSVITNMNTPRTDRASFGTWLESEIQHAGHNKRSFAEAIGVSHVTVGRWVAGRPPHAKYIDAIADVLLLDYDEVAERAGYRPRLPRDRVEALHTRFDPYLQRLDDDDLATIERILEGMTQDASDAPPSGRLRRARRAGTRPVRRSRATSLCADDQ